MFPGMLPGVMPPAAMAMGMMAGLNPQQQQVQQQQRIMPQLQMMQQFAATAAATGGESAHAFSDQLEGEHEETSADLNSCLVFLLFVPFFFFSLLSFVSFRV